MKTKSQIRDTEQSQSANQLDNFLENFKLPEREKSFASIHKLINAKLRAGQHVILVQVDGLGYDSALRAMSAGSELLNSIRKNGKFEKWSAQWPATTTVQMTTLYSGMSVEEHGLLEWVTYEPNSEMLISPLTFSRAREEERNTLQQLGIKPSDVFKKGQFAKDLVGQGFQMCLISKEEYLHSPMCDVCCEEANKYPVESLSEAKTILQSLLHEQSKPTFIVLYTDLLDKVNHSFTKNSEEHHKTLEEIISTLASIFKITLNSVSNDYSIIITSDHGHMSVDQENPIYVNKILPEIDSFLKKRMDGSVVECSGGYRSLFLYVIPEKRDLLIAELKKLLKGKADVYKIETLIDIGVFKKELCDEHFFARAGNVCVLPYSGQTVYYYIPGVFEMKRASLHGGASAEEMETPFFEFNKEQFKQIINEI